MLDSTLGPAGNQTYFRQVTYRIEGDLQPACVQAAFAELARRHDSLRTVFSRKNEDRWLQVVLHDWPGGFHYEDLRDREDRQARAEAYKQLDHRRGFDCTRDPLCRVAVLQLADLQFELIW